MRPVSLLLCLLALAACSSSKSSHSPADVTAAVDVQAPEVASDAAVDDAAEEVAPWNQSTPVVSQAGSTAKGDLQAGIAAVPLSSPIGVSMGGYGGRSAGAHTSWSKTLKGSRGMYAELGIKALALQVGSERLVLVKLPLLTSESHLLDRVCDKLAARGLDLRGRILTSAGHSHHATARFWPIPDGFSFVGLDAFDAEVLDRTAERIADAVQQAVADLKPAQWAWSQHENWDPKDLVYRDRRSANDPIYGKDPRLMLLGVRRGDDLLALILNFPIHGTVLGEDNDLLSEDAAGAVEQKVEEQYFRQHAKPLQAMFMNSAGGDAQPAGDELGHPNTARLEKLGASAAQLILPKLAELSWRSQMELAVRTVRLDYGHQRIYGAYTELLHEFDDANGAPYTWGGWQCKADGVDDAQSMAGKPKNCMDLSILVPAMGAPLPYGELSQVLLSAARLSDLGLLTLPGEPTYSIVKYARTKVEGVEPALKALMVLGYSQDYFLYLTAPDDWFLGGYESQMSLWGPGAGRFFADNGLALLADIVAGKTQPTFWQGSPSLSPPVPFTPRAVEAPAGDVAMVVQPPAEVSRTHALDFVFEGLDPALGPPLVELYVDVANPFVVQGPDGRAYSNLRGEMLTIYEPDPPIAPERLAQRHHVWRIRWQVPADLPVGKYGFQVSVPQATKRIYTYLTTSSVQVDPAPGTVITATKVGAMLQFKMTVPGQPVVLDDPYVWPKSGWRLLDYAAKQGETALVRAPLRVTFQVAGKPVAVVAQFSETDQANSVVPPAGWTGDAVQVEIDGSEGDGFSVPVK